MIRIDNLFVSFKDKQILSDITFEIPDKGFLSIVGKSGSGKSVLIKTILDLIKPDSGDIIFPDTLDKRKISMLFQNSALLDSMDIFHNVALPLKEHSKLSKTEISKAVSKTLNMVGLVDVENLMPSELSGGMRKRAALARAIIQNPEYIFFDEPTTGLDPIIAAEIIQLIKSLQTKLQFSAIIITHDIRFLEKLSGDIIMLKDKKICFKGSIEEFLSSQDEDIRFFIESY